MNSFYLLFVVLILFTFAYRLYGKYLARHFGEDSENTTPAHDMEDGVDFVPAKNWWILFGHHFSSICGAGPIVGPVLACAYWGWGISLVWIVVGAIWMGAVSDFSSLLMSVKSQGRSISQIAGTEISKRVQIYFSIFLWLSLILVIAVFSIFAAKTFISEPDAVLPSLGLIPVALITGWLFYRTRLPNSVATLFGLACLALLLWAGAHWPIRLPEIQGVSAENLWIFILLFYCLVASVMPVQALLQPRDYLASFILFAMIGIGLAGIAVKQPVLQAPLFTSFIPPQMDQAGPLWPMLFVTIACGAISGFHALVSSGTTCKQIANETHCRPIGYGGMLLEATVGVLVLIAVCAGLSFTDFRALLKEGGPITAFSYGYGSLSEQFLGDYGKAFAVLALNAFILTTLDTACRITRYITTEVFGIGNKYLATFIVVIASAALAITGKWGLLWPAFGAANQLIAGMTLLVASCWLLNRGKSCRVTFIPALIMLVTTVAAFLFQMGQSFLRRDPISGIWTPDWLMVLVALLLIALAISILTETVRLLKRE